MQLNDGFSSKAPVSIPGEIYEICGRKENTTTGIYHNHYQQEHMRLQHHDTQFNPHKILDHSSMQHTLNRHK
jgi:hypothetical protein